MRTAIAMAVLAASSSPAAADCGCGAWLLTEQIVEGKPYIVLESACRNLAKESPKITLVDAAGTAVPVTTVTTHDGYSNSGQLVLAPDRALAPGTYTLTHADRFDVSKLKLEVVAAPRNAQPPSWSGAATVLRQQQTEFGCGPAKTVEVQGGPDATLAFVELTDAAKRRTTGYVAVRGGKLSIGHGMCSGAFSLVKGGSYTAQITLLAPARGTSSTSKSVAFRYSP